MPYLPSHKTLFIHIPKCAGTSVEKWLSNLGPLRFRDEPVDPSWTLLSDCSRGHIKTMHLSYLDHVALLDLDPDDTFSFAIIRNPFTKILSHYLYMHERYDSPEGTVGKLEQYALAGTSASFGEFITRLTERKDLWARFGQLDYLLNKRGEVGVDILLRFENLNQEFALIKKSHVFKKTTNMHQQGLEIYHSFTLQKCSEQLRLPVILLQRNEQKGIGNIPDRLRAPKLFDRCTCLSSCSFVKRRAPYHLRHNLRSTSPTRLSSKDISCVTT